jgi:hypothetical protein
MATKEKGKINELSKSLWKQKLEIPKIQIYMGIE